MIGPVPARKLLMINNQPHLHPWISISTARLLVLALTLTLLQPLAVSANDLNLPALGDAGAGTISLQQERELGQAWLRVLRSQVRTHNDPEMVQYLENLLFDLAANSEIEDPRLDLVIINNPTMNAFAVPGGVVGVHTGLFLYAENEHQLASVLAHELAHLSQRHYARQLGNQKAASYGTLAGLLAGIVLAATVGSDAGMAAMTATQAAALDSYLRYSRQNEQEADRLGIETMVRSGHDPAAVPAMFERMLAATRYTGQKPPEFLMTHPLTEKRVADSRARSSKYPSRHYIDPPEYALMRARALIAIDRNPGRSIQRFRQELEGHSLSDRGATYGLSLALSAAGEYREARATLMPLLQKEPGSLTLQLAMANIDRAAGRHDEALSRVDNMAFYHPDSYALKMARAEILMQANRYGESQKELESLSKSRPTDPEVWFQLAEVSGLAGDIAGVHKARAEYFILTGIFDKAREHLGYAKRLLRDDYKENSILDQRLRDLAALEKRAKKI